MSQLYTLTFLNLSRNTGNFSIFQQTTPQTGPIPLPVVWKSQFTQADGRAHFSWNLEPCFVWGRSGPLRPDTYFHSNQVWPIILNEENTIELTSSEQAFKFENPSLTPPQNRWQIRSQSSIPEKTVSVGIGMDRQATMVLQAKPEELLRFIPAPQYWLTFGPYTSGSVIDPNNIANKVQLEFPPNTYAMIAILLEDFTWRVQTLAAYNQS